MMSMTLVNQLPPAEEQLLQAGKAPPQRDCSPTVVTPWCDIMLQCILQVSCSETLLQHGTTVFLVVYVM